MRRADSSARSMRGVWSDAWFLAAMWSIAFIAVGFYAYAEYDALQRRKAAASRGVDVTAQEHKQGWLVMSCGCHAYIWRATLLRVVPAEAIEYCPIARGSGVRLDALPTASALEAM